MKKGVMLSHNPLDLSGRDERIRTSGFCVPNAALYQAEPHPVVRERLLEYPAGFGKHKVCCQNAKSHLIMDKGTGRPAGASQEARGDRPRYAAVRRIV